MSQVFLNVKIIYEIQHFENHYRVIAWENLNQFKIRTIAIQLLPNHLQDIIYIWANCDSRFIPLSVRQSSSDHMV